MTHPFNRSRAYDWIMARLDEGLEVNLATYGRVTRLQPKHRDMVRVRGGSLEVQHGKKWLDYTFAKITAQ